MKNFLKSVLGCVIVISLFSGTSGCTRVAGCTNANSINYNSGATKDDGSCIAKISGCTDINASNYNSQANVPDGSCTYTGKVVFWYNAGGTNATVHIGGLTGTVDGSHYYTAIPDCGSLYCATFTLPTGSYSFTASSTFTNWTGTVTVLSNLCTAQVLQ